MSRWMQVVAVALAAVVGLLPAFAQLGYAQAVLLPTSVLPVGEEMADGALDEIVGESYPGFTSDVVMGAALGIAAGFTASQSGASLEVSIAVGAFTFLGFVAGRWPRPPTAPSLWDLLFEPLQPLRNPRRYLY